MSERGGATVSYFGVNEAYQLALAAQEAGLLDAFYCSLYDAPGKWGGRLAALLGRETLANRRCAGFNPADAIEIPWPFIGERVKSLFRSPGNEPAWFKTSDAFDRRVAKRLASSGSRVLVATEMCALQSFRVARDKGMKRVLDCPQVHMDFLNRVLSDAATDLGLSRSRQSDSDDVLSRKAKEYEMADKILVFSDVHRRSFFEAGFSAERIVQIPLW
ncbi:MAG TPA: hypothetical protein PKA41_18065, partial [Verrucomicrobiota bacterium]|nr:hypothetical protein [Verrucomicrobiota bacterium]